MIHIVPDLHHLLMFYVPGNSNDHVGTLPPFLWDFYPKLGCHDTQNGLHKYNHTAKPIKLMAGLTKKVQVGKDQEKAQSEKDSHSKNRGGKKTN